MDNPFVYDAAATLSEQDIMRLYIEDHNFSRFIQSSLNVCIIGERGSGKTITFLYNMLKCREQLLSENKFSHPHLAIYIPCGEPILRKSEHDLLDEYKARMISEHYLYLLVSYQIAEALGQIDQLQNANTKKHFCNYIAYLLVIEIN